MYIYPSTACCMPCSGGSASALREAKSSAAERSFTRKWTKLDGGSPSPERNRRYACIINPNLGYIAGDRCQDKLVHVHEQSKSTESAYSVAAGDL